MQIHDHSELEGHPQGSLLTSRAGLVLLGFLVIGAALLITEHRAHDLGALVWLLLLACPLMHLFLHHGHGGDGGHAGQDSKGRGP